MGRVSNLEVPYNRSIELQNEYYLMIQIDVSANRTLVIREFWGKLYQTLFLNLQKR